MTLTGSRFLRSNRWNKNLKISTVAKSGRFWQKWNRLYFSKLPHLAGCPSRKDSKSRNQALEVIKQVLIPSDNNLKSCASKLTRRPRSENYNLMVDPIHFTYASSSSGQFLMCIILYDEMPEWISWKTAKCHFISNGTLKNFQESKLN